ncbi:hemerythrin domain-containing protein [Glycomyces sp. TRM65418]|uniref:hemerythrin domain-containing protein n=1 Tax=Glycomyces sp. TRM65418 TaxID=2867006 RepID=UPI001CE4F7AF|nr:hemerythrin domain-containing protein [Glycomyces sp. TRM65418]MCC3765369.1 hemerythrin domain-containing protein [Glycomyces sp. TRM65418]QZD54986.1 hemerythrin domain-containing protein [Glycomyces sp. TRM65418]
MSADVVELIMQDHREVERLFDQLKNSPETRPLLTPVLAALLVAHSRAEEAEVYPAAKDEAGDVEDVAHSQEEHAKAEQMLKRLVEADPESDQYGQLLTELEEAISHHVEEEESKVLPDLKEAFDEQRRMQLGKAFVESRTRHLGEMPGEATKEELQWQAHNMGLAGASTMDKAELEKELKARASL